MISTSYQNTEIKHLVERGKSKIYEKIAKSRTMMEHLRSFFVILSTIDSTEELKGYKFFDYHRDANESWAKFCVKKLSMVLLFTEQHQGTHINIHNIII